MKYYELMFYMAGKGEKDCFEMAIEHILSQLRCEKNLEDYKVDFLENILEVAKPGVKRGETVSNFDRDFEIVREIRGYLKEGTTLDRSYDMVASNNENKVHLEPDSIKKIYKKYRKHLGDDWSGL